MRLFFKKVPVYRQKKFLIPFCLFVFLLLFRMVLPTALKIGLNSYLKDFSPTLEGKVGDVDLGILRGVVTLEDLSLRLKDQGKEFLLVRDASARLLWRDLFKGKVVADVFVDNADFLYTDGLLPAFKEHQTYVKKKDKEEGKEEKEKKPSAVRIAKFDLKNSIIRTDLFPKLTKEQGTVLTQIEARATNLTPTEDVPRTPFTLEALLLKSGKIKTEGEAKLLGDKPQWTVDSEMKNFDLTSLNRFLKQKVPLTFTRGKLDLYAEAATQGEVIKGYVKPFIKNLDVIKTDEKFKGPRHWLIEMITALGNVVMKADQTMATRVPFTFDKTLKPDKDQTIAKAFKHGFVQQLNRGIENTISLEKNQTKQSQEEK